MLFMTMVFAFGVFWAAVALTGVLIVAGLFLDPDAPRPVRRSRARMRSLLRVVA